MSGRLDDSPAIGLVVVLVASVSLVSAGSVVSDSAATLADSETKRVAVGAAVATTPTEPEPETGTETPEGVRPPGDPDDSNSPGGPGGPGDSGDTDRPAISFVAVCLAPDMPDGEFAIRPAASKEGERTEPVAAQWRTTAAVSTIVVKAGRGIETFSGGSEGTVTVGEGTPAVGVSPARPCPANERRFAKLEWDGGRFVPESE